MCRALSFRSASNFASSSWASVSAGGGGSGRDVEGAIGVAGGGAGGAGLGVRPLLVGLALSAATCWVY